MADIAPVPTCNTCEYSMAVAMGRVRCAHGSSPFFDTVVEIDETCNLHAVKGSTRAKKIEPAITLSTIGPMGPLPVGKIVEAPTVTPKTELVARAIAYAQMPPNMTSAPVLTQGLYVDGIWHRYVRAAEAAIVECGRPPGTWRCPVCGEFGVAADHTCRHPVERAAGDTCGPIA